MWLQNPVLTVHDVEGSHGGFVIQGKHENLVGVGQIFGRAGREDVENFYTPANFIVIVLTK